MPNSPRRWFAFRLRTLLVMVAVLSAPLAWAGRSLFWINRRSAAAKEAIACAFCPAGDFPVSGPKVFARWPLHIFGELGADFIWMKPGTDEERVRQVAILFPEARVGTARGSYEHGWTMDTHAKYFEAGAPRN
jgi:hypothetical protein